MKVRRILDQAERDQMSYPTPRPRPLVTNGFKVDLPETVEVIVRELPDPSEVKAERKRLDEYWFVHWISGKLYHLRLKAGGPNVDGEVQSLRVSEHPWLLRARLDDAIGQAVSQYDPIRVRPFTFLAQRAELVGMAAEAAAVSHPLLDGFKVTPRFALNAKIYEAADGAPHVGVFVTVGMHQDIETPLSDLEAGGLDLTG